MVRMVRSWRPMTLGALALAMAAASLALHAQSGGIYSITRSTIDVGGGTSTGGPYVVQGTIGQVDAHEPLSGGVLRLQPGFWAAAGTDGQLPAPTLIFRNGFEGPP